MALSATALADAGLPPAVRNALGYRNIPEKALSVYVEDLATAKAVLAWNEAVPRNPASV